MRSAAWERTWCLELRLLARDAVVSPKRRDATKLATPSSAVVFTHKRNRLLIVNAACKQFVDTTLARSFALLVLYVESIRSNAEEY